MCIHTLFSYRQLDCAEVSIHPFFQIDAAPVEDVQEVSNEEVDAAAAETTAESAEVADAEGEAAVEEATTEETTEEAAASEESEEPAAEESEQNGNLPHTQAYRYSHSIAIPNTFTIPS